MARNVVNIEDVSKAFDIKELLVGVSLGVSEGDRIGIVGRNGSGKSTLMKVMAGIEPPDSGRVTKSNAVKIGLLSQVDLANPESTVGEVVLGDAAKHEWASDPNIREVFTGLFGSFDDHIFDRKFGQLSGGERRRVGLAKLLINELDLILLDEPTNHLDVEGVAWLAKHLRKRRELAVVVITHDRWFLDEVSDSIWEVIDGKVESYEGGYSAYVLAKAERARQAGAEDARRNNLIRKELAWLRRGAPARTSKPKFRVDAANQLISAEPAPRNSAELLNFATNRLGNTVYEIHNAKLSIGETTLIEKLNWNIGPADRIAIVGVNGSGKTTLMRTLAGQYRFSSGKLQTGITVKAAFLSQHLEELNPSWRVLEAVENVALRVDLAGGREISASQLCERLGFDYEGQQKMVRDLSGGEKRRLQLTRLLMASPNVLLLDEPTNDFDVETLTALEDLLDTYAGVIIVISHDRYFLERVCDRFVGLLGNETLQDLALGIEQYLELRAEMISRSVVTEDRKEISGAAQLRLVKKELAKVEKQLERVIVQEQELIKEQESASFDHQRLLEVGAKLTDIGKVRSELEDKWLELSGQVKE